MKKLFFIILASFAFATSAFAVVNVNTATKEELTTLKGIGDAKAKAIIDYRTKNGPFKSVEDVDKVPGIGPGILGKIKGDLAVTGKTTVPTETAKKDEKVKKDKKDKKAAKGEEKAATPATPAKPATPATKDTKAATPAIPATPASPASPAEKGGKK